MTQFLVGPVFPFLSAGLVLLAGLLLLWRGKAGRGWRRGLGFTLGGLFSLFGLALGVGAVAMSNAARELEAARPAGGTLVTVGGEQLFVKCEGP